MGTTPDVADLADLGVVEAAEALRRRACSSLELTEACLARIAERDGTHSFDGDLDSINAWVRVYEEDARADARAADERLAAGGAPALCGIPIGLKDLYAAAGKPLTASSRVLDEVPERDCAVWARLRAEGMVLLGHLHTHEFAVGGTCDQVGNPRALDRIAGGSSGGSAAALAAGMTPAATGTDTAGSLRIPSALCGTSTIKPTRGLLPLDGIVPLAPSLDHPGPMARTLTDCAPLLDAMAGGLAVEPRPLAGLRLAVSPRVDESRLDPDVAAAFDGVLEVLRSSGAILVDAPPPDATLRVGDDFLGVLRTELHAWHLRFADRRELYRPALREWVTAAEEHPPVDLAAIAERRRATTAVWEAWLRDNRVFALVEPTVPVVAWPRGDGYERAGSDAALIALTHYWDWTGFPAVALPAGPGRRSELPTSVSLIGAPGSDGTLLGAGIALEHRLR